MSQTKKTKDHDDIVIIGEGTMVSGFRLAGVVHAFELEQEPAEKKITELMDTAYTGLIITSEKIYRAMDWRLKRKIEAAAKPVVVAIPGPEGPVAQEESISDMIKRAMGIDLMAQEVK